MKNNEEKKEKKEYHPHTTPLHNNLFHEVGHIFKVTEKTKKKRESGKQRLKIKLNAKKTCKNPRK